MIASFSDAGAENVSSTENFWFVSPEDFILQKLKVGRPQDFEDAVAVLQKPGHALDHRYLIRWAARLGISGELDYVLNL